MTSVITTGQPAATQPTIVATPTTAPVQKTVLDRSLSLGQGGDDVEQLQARLADLAFDPGPIDGSFGPRTQQAVWAYEKLVLGVPRTEATGIVTPEMWDRMQDPQQVAPRRPVDRRPPDSGDHVEIYLPEQVMAIFHGDRPVLITHVSTGQQNPDGTPYEYSEDVTIDTDENGNLLEEPVTKPIKGLAYTPPGVFQAGREVVGVRNGPLGGMFDPVYINQGIAIHGARNVPLEPASHGCIRVHMDLGPVVQELVDRGDFVYIWGGEREPEQVPEEDRLMIWDWLDTSRTTTTTSTTTTTTTTVAPTTQPSPTTTTQAPTTTTSEVPPTTEPSESTGDSPDVEPPAPDAPDAPGGDD
jgi:peptidoglycan hydrolase-like protein with peptidoglycan-binding domain